MKGPSDNLSPVSPSSLTVDDFQLLRVIGRGSFGKVLLVRGKRDKRVYALKILLKSHVVAKNQVEHTKSEHERFWRKWTIRFCVSWSLPFKQTISSIWECLFSLEGLYSTIFNRYK